MPVVRDEELARQRKPVRYPYCVVWTPIPVLTWIFPLIGHTGIATSEGKIRDFAGSYYVAEDDMAFGAPTKIWKLNLDLVKGSTRGWDYAVNEASLDYGSRIHNLFCDNCHSHVAKALNLMEYNDSQNWNMLKIALYMFINGRYVSKKAWFKTWIPFWIFLLLILSIIFCARLAN